ncbi:2-amino-4-hydroxy-6-hydroxymethyldihydropteridine diphosphokinase [Candidatus Nitrosacidococcus tergens]|uniref:2-amino-4-hydroxy-6-hydroxymethyldihydropteridine diphosphokinase n=1 Tax=Candidatus Nitrosacidococcus tergens TaxID=553981 RepID=A0A7G1Q7Q4_9GAMM|nr:2-amino-4-hydroxy-6-hydroxymethyldihydropteridine diphosphokinase [Candidatus Nitrosacidococcus tergens]CAB1274135.1 2-amino-4-hydroxy-6-hydroxymethyldihydropteridinepyrophosphokinase [Candidatus Nitrosacidococcus tergens]
MARAYVSIGSNIEKEKNIRASIYLLQNRYSPLTISQIFESESIGFQGDNFYNLVVGFNTTESVEDLVSYFNKIEQLCGRKQNGTRFSSRPLDLDLLLYDDLILNLQQPKVQIPREDIIHYAFVLQPLAEIAPNEVHPILKKPYMELWHSFNKSLSSLWPIEIAL